MDFVIDVAFVVATVAFFKQQFGLRGLANLGTAFVAVAFVAFLPDIVALMPGSEYYVAKIVTIIKLFFAAPGLFDAAVDVGAKIKRAAIG